MVVLLPFFEPGTKYILILTQSFRLDFCLKGRREGNILKKGKK